MALQDAGQLNHEKLHKGTAMLSAFCGKYGKKKGFGAIKSEKWMLLEALENRALMSGGYYDDSYYENPGYEDPTYEDPYGGYYGGGYGDGGYNGDPVDDLPQVSHPDMMYFEIGTKGTKINLGHYFMDGPSMASQLTFYVATNTDPTVAIGADIVDNYLVVTFDSSKVGWSDVEVVATDASGQTVSGYFHLVIDETAKNGPAIVTTPTLTMPEDSGPVRLDLNAIFDDTYTPDEELVFGVSPYFAPLIGSAVIDGHELVVTPATNLVGSVGVVVSATDRDGQSTTYMVLVTVTDVVPTMGTVTANQTEFREGDAALKAVEFTVDGILPDAHNKVSIFLDTDGDGLLNLTKDQRLVISSELEGEVRHATADLSFLGAGTHTILAVAWEDNNWYSGSQLSPIASMSIEIDKNVAMPSTTPIEEDTSTPDEGPVTTTSEGEEEPPNSAPMANVGFTTDLELGVTETKIDLWTQFSDEQDLTSELAFGIVFIDNTGGVPLIGKADIIDNRYLIVTFVSDVPSTGSVTVYAQDTGFLSAETTFSFVMASETNNPPIVVNTPQIQVNEDSASFTLDLKQIFEDYLSPDSDLTFTLASVSSSALLTAKVDGSDLIVSFGQNKWGTGTVGILATDPEGNSTYYGVPVFVADVVPTTSGVTVDGERYTFGSPELKNVEFAIADVLTGAHNNVSVFVDSNKNGILDLKTDVRVALAEDVAGGLVKLTADLSALPGGDYTFLAVAWEDNFDEFTGSQLSAVAVVTIEIFEASTEGTVTKLGQSVTYTDINGNTVKATLTGPGSLEVFFDSAAAKHNASRIEITGSDAAKSSLAISVTAAKGSASLTTDVGDIVVIGGLTAFKADKVNLMGDLDASGFVKALTLNDVNNLAAGHQHEINIGGGAKDKMTVALGRVSDLSLTTGATITSLKAADWIDGNKVNDVVQAAGLGMLTTTGHKASGAAGDFDADLKLTNPAAAKTTQTVTSITIAGDARGNWDLGDFKLQGATIKGDAAGSWVSKVGVGTVQVYGDLTGFKLETDGDLGSFKGGQVTSSQFLVDGALKSFSSINFIAGLISADTAGSISITGRAASKAHLPISGNYTGDLMIGGLSTKGNEQSLRSLTVAGLAVGNGNSGEADWTIHGNVGSMTLGSATSLIANISKAGTTTGSLGLLKVGQATFVELTVGGKLGSLTATNWALGRLAASSLGTMNVTGSRNNKGALVGGDFTGQLTVGGGDVSKNGLAVQSINVAGSALGAPGAGPLWLIGGNVGSITVGRAQELAIVVGDMDGASAGKINSFKVGEAINTFLNAEGKIGSVTATSYKGGAINAGSVGSLTVSGGFEAHIDITGKSLGRNDKALGTVTIGGTVVGSGTVESPDWSVLGPVGSVTLGAVVNLAAHFDDTVGSVTIKGEATGMKLVANGHFDEEASKSFFGFVGSMKAGKITNSYIQADKLGSLAVSGITHGKTSIAGELNNTYVYIVGSGVENKFLALGAATVSGAVNNSQFNLLGNTGTVTVGAFLSSQIRVGVSDEVPATSLPETASDFAMPTLSLGGFVVTGKAVADVEAPTFVNSLVSAPKLTNVSLKLVTSTLPTQTGFAASSKIGTYTRLESVTPKVTVTVKNKTVIGTYDTEGLYVLKLV